MTAPIRSVTRRRGRRLEATQTLNAYYDHDGDGCDSTVSEDNDGTTKIDESRTAPTGTNSDDDNDDG